MCCSPCKVTRLRRSREIAGFKWLNSDMCIPHVWEISQLSSMHLLFFFYWTLILPLGPEPFPLLVKSLVCTLSFTSSSITGVMILMRINYRADWPPTPIKLLNTTLAGNTTLAKLLPASTKPIASLGVTRGTHLDFLKTCSALSLRKGTSVPSAL